MKLHKNIEELLKKGVIPSRLPEPNNETISEFIKNDLSWWRDVGYETDTPAKRKHLYKRFLNRFNEHTGKDYRDYDKRGYKVAEIAGGPFGGLLDLFFEKVTTRTQIDLLASNFQELKYETNYSYEWFTCPAEHILKDDNTYDFLIGYNSLDHGWDIKKAIDECIRVSKSGLINFDTDRYKNPGYPDRSHYQIVDYDKVLDYISNIKCIKNNWYINSSIPDGSVNVFEFYWSKL